MADDATEGLAGPAGWVAGGNSPESAGIPAFAAFTGFLGPLVNDVETVAGGADKSAGAATDTAYGNAIPERIFKVTVQPTFDLL